MQKDVDYATLFYMLGGIKVIEDNRDSFVLEDKTGIKY